MASDRSQGHDRRRGPRSPTRLRLPTRLVTAFAGPRQEGSQFYVVSGFEPEMTTARTRMIQTRDPDTLDVALIGAGIMSATLGTVLKELEPSLDIAYSKRLRIAGSRVRRPGRMRVPATRRIASRITRPSALTGASTSPKRARSTPSSICRARYDCCKGCSLGETGQAVGY
jgi:Malate:quinone oxidoreductase (Mqo)